MSKPFNPLESLSSTPGFMSKSAFSNLEVGICPKCKSNMRDDARLGDGTYVYFCDKCRVSSPLPDRNV